MDTEQKILKARSGLIMDSPFFGCLALKLKLEEKNDMVPTAGTDGEHMYYNSEWINTLSLQEVKGVLAHEVMHCAVGHQWRVGDRDKFIWNVAGDYIINDILNEAGFTLPEGRLLDAKYKNKSTEEVYTLVYKEAEKQKKEGKGKGNNQDPGNCGTVLPSKTKAEANKQEGEWKVALAQAGKMKDAGSLPSSLKRMIKELINPEVPWYTLLRDFVEKTARNDYNWTRPNSRYLNRDIILPSLLSEELPEVVVVVDTSGSIGTKELDLFASEVSGILSCYKTVTRVIYCDYNVQGEEVFSSEDMPIHMKAKGGGGTSFSAAFKYVAEKAYSPACLIYFTDLYCDDYPRKAPDYPVLWVSTEKGKKGKFGTTVEFNGKDRQK